MLVKYIGNPTPNDLTASLQLASDEGAPRALELNGPAVEVSGDEFRAIVANGYQLKVVDEADDDDADDDADDKVPVVPIVRADPVVPNLPPQSPAASTQPAVPGV